MSVEVFPAKQSVTAPTRRSAAECSTVPGKEASTGKAVILCVKDLRTDRVLCQLV